MGIGFVSFRFRQDGGETCAAMKDGEAIGYRLSAIGCRLSAVGQKGASWATQSLLEQSRILRR
jgi:hypothetical protein